MPTAAKNTINNTETQIMSMPNVRCLSCVVVAAQNTKCRRRRGQDPQWSHLLLSPTVHIKYGLRDLKRLTIKTTCCTCLL